jgi:hypothetical protein
MTIFLPKILASLSGKHDGLKFSLISCKCNLRMLVRGHNSYLSGDSSCSPCHL